MTRQTTDIWMSQDTFEPILRDKESGSFRVNVGGPSEETDVGRKYLQRTERDTNRRHGRQTRQKLVRGKDIPNKGERNIRGPPVSGIRRVVTQTKNLEVLITSNALQNYRTRTLHRPRRTIRDGPKPLPLGTNL